MTNRQVVSRLRQEGHEVGVYVRKDGGIRITSIDGVKYSDRKNPKTGQPSGIQAARDLLFQEGRISNQEKEAYKGIVSQRSAARLSISIKGNIKPSLKAQSEAFKAEYKALATGIKKLNRRLIKEKKRAFEPISWQRTLKAAEKAGISVEAQLRRASDYFSSLFSDIAPSVLVKQFIETLEMYEQKHPELKKLTDFVEENKGKLDIYALDKAANWLYGYGKGVQQSQKLDEIVTMLENSLH